MASVHPLSSNALFSVKGWVAVVTGGGTGIGLMAARTLAANGAKVYIAGRRKNVLDESAKIHGNPEALGGSGGSLVPLEMDIVSKESIKKVVDTITKADGKVDVLVNNAGVGGGRAGELSSRGAEVYGNAMFEEDMEDWQKVYLSNNTAVYFVTAGFVPLLSAAAKGVSGRPGNVVNISSLSGITKWSQYNQYSYNCSKAATNHLTRMLAYELSNEAIGIRVNAICPGYFPSELTLGSSNADNRTTWSQVEFDAGMKRVGANVPAGRPGTEEEMASAVLLLATNAYIFGSVLVVDGGILLRHPGTA